MAMLLARAILWGAGAYLAALGVVAMVASARAHAFLAGFAQTRRANWLEAIVRALIGIAFIVAAPTLALSGAARVAGGFLLVTALLMPLAPDLHRRVASRSVARVAPYLVWLGLASLLLAAGLAALLLAAGQTRHG